MDMKLLETGFIITDQNKKILNGFNRHCFSSSHQSELLFPLLENREWLVGKFRSLWSQTTAQYSGYTLNSALKLLIKKKRLGDTQRVLHQQHSSLDALAQSCR